MFFVGECKVVMDGVDIENLLSVLKDWIKYKELEKKLVYRIYVLKWKCYVMFLVVFLCGLLVFVGVLYWIFFGKLVGYIFVIELGQWVQVVLLDGMKVWLNVLIQIVYKFFFWKWERQVDLSGEVYFEVLCNKIKFFVVNSNDVRICVFGIKFNVWVCLFEEKVVIILLKGLVKV